MDLKMMKKIIPILLLLSLVGCVSNSRKITVNISNHYWNKTVYVDVAGIKDNMLQEYKTCSKDEYWGVDGELRSSLYSANFMFNKEDPLKKVVSENDSLWEYWGNDDFLIVFAELPKPYANVQWKIIVPLEYYSWFNFWDDRNVNLYISDRGIKLLDKELVFSDRSMPHKDAKNVVR